MDIEDDSGGLNKTISAKLLNVWNTFQETTDENGFNKEMDLVLLGISSPKGKVEKRKKWLIYPADSFKTFWDIFISVVLLVSVFTTPLDLAFPSILDTDLHYFRFTVFIDIMFLIDIFINFVSVIQSENFALIDNR
jgi:hypothetical protein